MLNTDVQARKWKPVKPGERASFGNSLYLRGYGDGTKVFELRTGKTWVVLGRYPTLSLEQARAMVPVCKRLLKDGRITLVGLKALATRTNKAHELEELATRQEVAAFTPNGMMTFDQAFRDWYNLQIRANRWTHAASRRRPISCYENHAKAALGNLRLDEIRRQTIKSLIQPLFLTHPETAGALLGYIWEIMERAYDDELLDQNPCPRQRSFTIPNRKIRHAASLHFSQLPDLWRWIDEQSYSRAMKVAMRLAVVTAHRASVVAYMRKAHVDAASGLWVVPARDLGAQELGLMKSGREFKQRLPRVVMEDLEHLLSSGASEFVFSVDGIHPIHPESLRRNFKKFADITTHGFRNCFKTWCLHHDVDPFLADRYVDHAPIGLDKNYRRDDLFEQRAALAEKYAAFITQGTS